MRQVILAVVLLTAAFPAWPQAGKPRRAAAPTPRPNHAPDIDRLQHLSPAQRSAALQGLPPRRQQRIEERLQRLDQMDPVKRERLLQRYRQFQGLPPATQNQIRDLGRRLQELPDDRQPQVRGAINRLRQLPPEQSERLLTQPNFKNRFSSGELELIRRGAQLWHDGLEPR